MIWLGLLGLALRSALRKDELDERRSRYLLAAFGVISAVFLILARWRSLTFPGEFNVDESMNIAQGLKYLEDPVPWRSVDAMTCGPLSTWVNLWAPLLGLPLSYLTLRLTTLLLIWVTIVATTLCAREMVGSRYSLLSVFPALTLLASTSNTDFVTSALEYLPVAMASVAIFLLLSDLRSPHALKVFFLGVITGALPFTKLQAAPSGVFLFGVGAAFLYRTRRATPPSLWKHGAWLCLGGLTVPALILIPVLLAGAWREFLTFYLVSGTSYGNGATLLTRLEFLINGNIDFTVFAIASLGVLVIFLALVQKRAPMTEWWIGTGLLTSYGAIVLYCALRPGFEFPHYLIFLVIPTTLLTTWALKAFLSFPIEIAAKRRNLIAPAALCALLLAQAENAFLSHLQDGAVPPTWKIDNNSAIPLLQRYAKPGDVMGMWGRIGRFYALTGLRPATRFIDTAYVMDPDPQYAHHRQLYLEDLKRSQPRLFVDACDEVLWPAWPRGELARHERLPELAEWVRRDYRLEAEILTHRPGVPVRIYVRKD